ncbi:ABC transporter ATP-binding protein [Limimaricola soesokkakensis]|uniref:ABC transporter ATP-binding protein n=1 Tax=Limimaricola soesokkakensis TaxID=1343159 RepID=UPI003515921E
MDMQAQTASKDPAARTAAIEARGLRKTYKASNNEPEKHALKGVDLVVPRGSIFGLLGPNGAGKSTFINILAGLVMKTEGEVDVWGFNIDQNPRQARASIGVVPQELNIDPFFTPAEALELQAGLYGVPKSERRTMEILEAMGLADKANAYARTLSDGMRRRLLVGKAMVHSPPVIVLDEPTAGVDIELRQQLWAYVKQLNERGVTIVLTTHYLEEAESLCDEIAIINHGEVVACEKTPDLVARLDRKSLLVTPDTPLDAVPAGLDGYETQILPGGLLEIAYRPSGQNVAEILDRVNQAGIAIRDLSIEEGHLEDVFLELTRSKAA